MNQNPGNTSTQPPEETLRLVAQLPPPEELTDRVHQRLAHEQAKPLPHGFWAHWMPAQRLQFAAAAVLTIAVASSTWAVYHTRSGQNAMGAHIVPPAPNSPAASPNVQQGGGFSTAGAVRVPPTLAPIKVPPAAKKKSAAGHRLAKPSPAKLAPHPATESKPAGNP